MLEQNIFWSPPITLLVWFLLIPLSVTLFVTYIKIKNYPDEKIAHSTNTHLDIAPKDKEQGSNI